MKKLIIAAAAIMFGIAVNAATYNWTVKSGWVSPDDDVSWDGAAVYVYDANVYSSAAVLSALESATDGGAATFANALQAGAVSGDGFTMSGAGLTDDGGTPDKFAHAYAILVADDGAGNNYAYLMDNASDVKITSTIVSGAYATFNQGDVVTGDVGGAGWTKIGTAGPSPIPEPTSGLMLLLGVAGLALRRKRA